MTGDSTAGLQSYVLESGYVYFNKRNISVVTVLGSSVAVCIWDKILRYGGMNHFFFPFTKDASKATPRYGNVAIAALVKIMEEAGCKRSNMRAMIFGGAQKEGLTNEGIGYENVRIAREILNRKLVPIASEDTGGTMGRKVLFSTATGEAAVLKTHKIRESDWY